MVSFRQVSFLLTARDDLADRRDVPQDFCPQSGYKLRTLVVLTKFLILERCESWAIILAVIMELVGADGGKTYNNVRWKS
jgi:hypothetical protein